jgi:hypothetical protein
MMGVDGVLFVVLLCAVHGATIRSHNRVRYNKYTAHLSLLAYFLPDEVVQKGDPLRFNGRSIHGSGMDAWVNPI